MVRYKDSNKKFMHLFACFFLWGYNIEGIKGINDSLYDYRKFKLKVTSKLWNIAKIKKKSKKNYFLFPYTMIIHSFL